jgi:hypothetical protein
MRVAVLILEMHVSHQTKPAPDADRPSALTLADRLRRAIAACDLPEAEELFGMISRHFISRVHKAPLVHVDEFSVIQGVRRRAKVRVRKDRRLGLATQAAVISSLVAYARLRTRPEVIATIRDLHRSFVLRFHDPIYGGFFDIVDLESGAPRGGKNWELILDVACDYLLEIAALEDAHGGSFGGHAVDDIASIACDVAAQRPDGAIFELTIADRRPKWRDWQPRSMEISRLPFSAPKTAWLLCSVYARTHRDEFAEAAIKTFTYALDRAFDWDTGKWSSIPRATAQRIGFWSGDAERDRQAQAVRALSYLDQLGLLDRLRAARGTGREALEKSVARAPHPHDGSFL